MPLGIVAVFGDDGSVGDAEEEMCGSGGRGEGVIIACCKIGGVVADICG